MSHSRNSRRGTRNSPRFPCGASCSYCNPAIRRTWHERDVAKVERRDLASDLFEMGDVELCDCFYGIWTLCDCHDGFDYERENLFGAMDVIERELEGSRVTMGSALTFVQVVVERL